MLEAARSLFLLKLLSDRSQKTEMATGITVFFPLESHRTRFEADLEQVHCVACRGFSRGNFSKKKQVF